ncbi:MAG: T9SS type A sorting domain-containing protein, partial [Saprospiraceae bacterium]
GLSYEPQFLWANGDTSNQIIGLTAGTYNLTITDRNRCEETLVIHLGKDCILTECLSDLVINENLLKNQIYQSINTIESNSTVAKDSAVFFKAEQSITLKTGFIVEKGGEFNAQITDCVSSNLIVKDSTISTKTNLLFNNFQAIKEEFKIYPNPVKNTIYIESSLKNYQLTIFNTIGQKVHQKIVKESNHQIGVSHLPVGVYFVNINGQIIEKIIIQSN